MTGTLDWFLHWHTQVHSANETSCSKSPTFHVCAVIIPRDLFACSVAEIPCLNLLRNPYGHRVFLESAMLWSLYPFLPWSARRGRHAVVALYTLLIRTFGCKLCSLASPNTTRLSATYCRPIYICKFRSILHRHSMYYTHRNVLRPTCENTRAELLNARNNIISSTIDTTVIFVYVDKYELYALLCCCTCKKSCTFYV